MQQSKLIQLADDFRAAGITHKDYVRYCSHSANDPQELKLASDFKREVVNAFYPPGGIEPGTPPRRVGRLV